MKFVNLLLKQFVNMADMAVDAYINILVCAKITLGGVILDVIEIAGCSTQNSVLNHYNMGNAFVKKCFFYHVTGTARTHVNQIARNSLQSGKN